MVTFLPYRFCEFCFLFLNRGWKWHHVTAATITVSQRLAPPSLRHPAPSTPPLPRHPASPLLSQARSAIDTDEGVEKSHAKKAPLPLSLLHSDNDRLSSHSDQHCHPQHCSAQTHTQVYKCMQAHTHTHAHTHIHRRIHSHTHIHRTHGCENPHQPRQHWQPSHCCHFSYFYTGAWQHIKNPSRYGNNMRPLHQAH